MKERLSGFSQGNTRQEEDYSSRHTLSLLCVMDSAKRERREQVLRYYAREEEREKEERLLYGLLHQDRQPVVGFVEAARLKEAAITNDKEEISFLLKHNASRISEEDINVAFLQACIHCHENIARTLLEHGAFIDYRDGDHWTAVHFASAYGNKPILNLLFEYGADATLLDIDGNFALDYALNVTVKGLIAEEMAQSGVYMEDLPSIRTRQVKAMTAAVRSAITRGKDLTLPNRNGVTPLHTAAAYGYYEVVQLLVESDSVPISILDDSGCTPLHVAMKYRQTQIAKYLLQNGAKIEESMSEAGVTLEELAKSQHATLPNQWKLKKMSKDDTRRERHWLARHRGLVQDTPTEEEEEVLINDCIHFSKVSGMAGNDPLPHSGIPSSAVNDKQSNERGGRVEDGGVERKRHKVSISLQSIPEMIYDSSPRLATPTETTPPQLIEDAYDLVPYNSKPPKTIYDDNFSLSSFHGNSGGVAITRVSNPQELDSPSHTPLLMPSIPSRDHAQDHAHRPTSPSPYEEFVSIHSSENEAPSRPAPPIPARRNKGGKAHSEAEIFYEQKRNKTHRSISDSHIMGVWFKQERRDSTPITAPPLPPNLRKPIQNIEKPPIPPRTVYAQINHTSTQSSTATPTNLLTRVSTQLVRPPVPRRSSGRPLSALSPVHVSPDHYTDPPPSYATVFHCPDQLFIANRDKSPSPPPLPPHPTSLVRPQVRQRSEPHNIGFRKPQLRKILSGPITASDRSIALFNSAVINSSGSVTDLRGKEEERVGKIVKPYTFRTRFQ